MPDKDSRNFIYGIHTSNAQLKLNPTDIKKIFIKKNSQNKQLKKIISISNQHNIPLEEVEKDLLTTLSFSNKHQGVVCELNNLSLSNFNLDTYLQIHKSPFIVIFDSIQDPRNLGSCIRTANAAGVSLIIKKKANSCEISPLVHKAASGGLQGLSLLETNNLSSIIKKLKNNNITIIGTDHTASKSIYEMNKMSSGIAVIIGSEGDGISKSLLSICDEIYKVPIHGSVDCLNVSVAAGIVLYQTHLSLKQIK